MKIKKIVLEIKGKEHSMTIDEAKELRGELNKMFEKEIQYYPSPTVYPTYPRPYWDNGISFTNTSGSSLTTAGQVTLNTSIN